LVVKQSVDFTTWDNYTTLQLSSCCESNESVSNN